MLDRCLYFTVCLQYFYDTGKGFELIAIEKPLAIVFTSILSKVVYGGSKRA